MPIRLFTSGTHNGLTFSNADITGIANKTASGTGELIPIVLGHPKNNLPVLGYLPRKAITTYKEGDKVSLGFAREKAELADESMNAMRRLGCNKISIRLEDNEIKHIGLVERAAVSENNAQNFSAGTGDFAATDDFSELDKSLTDSVLDAIKTLFKNNKNEEKMKEENEEKEKQNAEFSALKGDVAKISETVEKLAGILTGQQEKQRKETVTADFTAAEFSHLTDEQKKSAVDFCTKATPVEAEALKAMLKAGNQKPATPPAGSVVNDFGKAGHEETSEELIRKQVTVLK